MSDGINLALVLIAGALLGLIFFGGLWWTVRQAVSSQWVALWFFASLALRTVIVMGGFFFVCGDDWRRWLAALLGFVLARLGVTRATRKLPPLMEVRHEP